MDSIKIFDEIAYLITHEFAGAEELRQPEAHVPFLRFCSDRAEHFGLEDRDLFLFVQMYLDVIGERKLGFDIRDYAGFKHFGRGFSARSDGKDLYVCAVDQETRLAPGDRIVQINQYSPAKFRQVSTFASAEKPLHERDRWDAYLNYAKFIVVERAGGTTEKVILKEFPQQVQPARLECRQMGAGATYLRVDKFTDSGLLEQWIRQYETNLAQCSRLILDLRHNSAGGMQETMSLIVPFIVDHATSDTDFFRYCPTYTRYSEKNCDLFLAGIRRYVEVVGDSSTELVDYYQKECDAHRGKGWAPDWDDGDDEPGLIHSNRSAEKVIILTDTSCADDAELLCLASKRIQGVTLLGRPTAGNIDYCNTVVADFGFGATFSYPISKTQDCMEGRGINQTGVPVDVYIPWTTAEIHSDILLQAALDL